ncbi:MAG: hypothetical protein ACYCW6_13425 [Candidatus Xenobia bacterium]
MEWTPAALYLLAAVLASAWIYRDLTHRGWDTLFHQVPRRR